MSIELPKGYALGNVEYTVIAGKYEADGERNIKFISEPFVTADEAIGVARMYETYPFCEVQLSAVVEVK